THPWRATEQHGPSYARRSATSPRFQDDPRLRHSQLAPPQRSESASRRAAAVPRSERDRAVTSHTGGHRSMGSGGAPRSPPDRRRGEQAAREPADDTGACPPRHAALVLSALSASPRHTLHAPSPVGLPAHPCPPRARNRRAGRPDTVASSSHLVAAARPSPPAVALPDGAPPPHARGQPCSGSTTRLGAGTTNSCSNIRTTWWSPGPMTRARRCRPSRTSRPSDRSRRSPTWTRLGRPLPLLDRAERQSLNQPILRGHADGDHG